MPKDAQHGAVNLRGDFLEGAGLRSDSKSIQDQHGLYCDGSRIDLNVKEELIIKFHFIQKLL
jgi:hypothetical protein